MELELRTATKSGARDGTSKKDVASKIQSKSLKHMKSKLLFDAVTVTVTVPQLRHARA